MWFLISAESRLQAFFLAAVLALACGGLFPNLKPEPKPGVDTSAARCGIISLEFAGSVRKAEAIKDIWKSQFGGLERAWLSIFLDFGFILAYSTAIGLACVLGQELFQKEDIGVGLGLPWIGVLLAWGVTIAGILDVVENLALMLVLRGTQDEVWPQLAYSCAALKFALVFAGIAYSLPWIVLSLPGWVIWGVSQIRGLFVRG